MIIHSVCFYLRKDLGEAERRVFWEELGKLKGIESLAGSHVGVPAKVAPRPTVDAEWDFGVTLFFKDLAAHDAYQVHPLHKAFLEKCRPMWEKVRITDLEEK